MSNDWQMQEAMRRYNLAEYSKASVRTFQEQIAEIGTAGCVSALKDRGINITERDVEELHQLIERFIR